VVPPGQRDGSLCPYSRFSRPESNVIGKIIKSYDKTLMMCIEIRYCFLTVTVLLPYSDKNRFLDDLIVTVWTLHSVSFHLDKLFLNFIKFEVFLVTKRTCD
jgi:hypothetical protein